MYILTLWENKSLFMTNTICFQIGLGISTQVKFPDTRQGSQIWQRPTRSSIPCLAIRSSVWKPGRKHRTSQKDLHGTSECSPRWQRISKHTEKQHMKCCWCFIELWTMATTTTQVCLGPSFIQQCCRGNSAYSAHMTLGKALQNCAGNQNATWTWCV